MGSFNFQVLRFSRLFKPVHTPHLWRKRRKKKTVDEEKKVEHRKNDDGELGDDEDEEEEEYLEDEEIDKLLKLELGRPARHDECTPDDEVKPEKLRKM